ncbi:MAG TPA: molybdenum cofactor guanylyltransferase [Actinomycetota bacterium]
MSRNARSHPRSTSPSMSGLVLCGGESARMGSEKALIEVGGEPLFLRVARRLARVADPVLLATGRPGRLGALGYSEVADERPRAGPLAGLAGGLAASPHELMAAVAVDMPLLSGDLLVLLATLHEDEDAVVPISAHGPEPLHALYARRALPALRAALDEGTLSMRVVLKGLRVREVPEAEWLAADPTGRFALNVNRAEDLAALGP